MPSSLHFHLHYIHVQRSWSTAKAHILPKVCSGGPRQPVVANAHDVAPTVSTDRHTLFEGGQESALHLLRPGLVSLQLSPAPSSIQSVRGLLRFCAGTSSSASDSGRNDVPAIDHSNESCDTFGNVQNNPSTSANCFMMTKQRCPHLRWQRQPPSWLSTCLSRRRCSFTCSLMFASFGAPSMDMMAFDVRQAARRRK